MYFFLPKSLFRDLFLEGYLKFLVLSYGKDKEWFYGEIRSCEGMFVCRGNDWQGEYSVFLTVSKGSHPNL